MMIEKKRPMKIMDNLLKIEISTFSSLKERETLLKQLETTSVQKLELNLEGVTNQNTALVAFVYRIIKKANMRSIFVELTRTSSDLKSLLDLALAVDRKPSLEKKASFSFLESIGLKAIALYSDFKKGCGFIKESLLSLNRLFFHKSLMRMADLNDALDSCGPKALGIVMLISFMVGLILAFVGAIQLKTFGAQIYVASLVTIGMIRIMGAIMVGIIMAGRTGASYSASIGTMQVNEELDALKTMGIPIHDFLVLPRVLALVIAMPLLVLLSDFAGMLGGASVGVLMLGIPAEEYWKYAIEAFGLANFLVGVFHGFVFAFIIAWCGCYYGVYCERNAQSVGVSTTKAVVSSIVWMIILTGLITLMCEVMGI